METLNSQRGYAPGSIVFVCFQSFFSPPKLEPLFQCQRFSIKTLISILLFKNQTILERYYPMATMQLNRALVKACPLVSRAVLPLSRVREVGKEGVGIEQPPGLRDGIHQGGCGLWEGLS